MDQDPIGTRRPPGWQSPGWRPPGWCRSLQLVLATAWLLDGVLQLQPVMFSRGPHGLSAMLAGTAAGNPEPVASSITWLAGVVGHHSAPADLAFATVQILLGLGIAWRRSVKAALAASVPWALAVWWFGEGLGGVLHGTGTPVLGGPGAVLLYAVLAVVLWPTGSAVSGGREADGGVAPFVAAVTLGARASRALWAALWSSMALLSLLGASTPPAVGAGAAGMGAGEPGWLAALDRHVAALVAARGLAVAAVVAVVCLAVAAGVYLPPAGARAAVVLAIATSLGIWVVTENLGTVLAGGATDPSSGPLLVVLALAYWPAPGARRASRARGAGSDPARAPAAELAGAR